jgi:hypothetical protein
MLRKTLAAAFVTRTRRLALYEDCSDPKRELRAGPAAFSIDARMTPNAPRMDTGITDSWVLGQFAGMSA